MNAPSKKLLVPFVTIAIVLALSSVAYACTAFRGVLELTGNKTPQTWTGAPTSETIGRNNGGMAHCDGSPTGYARATADDGWVDVLVRPTLSGDDCHGSTNKLSEDTDSNAYDVNFLNDAAFTGESLLSYRNWLIDCMDEDGSSVINLGDIKIDSAGYSLQSDGTTRGAMRYNLPDGLTANTMGTNDKPVDESAVCVSGPNGGNAEGNQGPITIVL